MHGGQDGQLRGRGTVGSGTTASPSAGATGAGTTGAGATREIHIGSPWPCTVSICLPKKDPSDSMQLYSSWQMVGKFCLVDAFGRCLGIRRCCWMLLQAAMVKRTAASLRECMWVASGWVAGCSGDVVLRTC